MFIFRICERKHNHYFIECRHKNDVKKEEWKRNCENGKRPNEKIQMLYDNLFK